MRNPRRSITTNAGKTIFSTLCLLVLGSSVQASNQAISRIARWKGNARAALSITIDDAGDRDSRNIQALLLEEYGLRGTFHIPTGQIGSRKYMFLDMFNRGHELGSHSVNHVNLKGASLTTIWSELGESQDFIEILTGAPCVSYCHPYGGFDDSVVFVAQQLYLSARGVNTHEGVNALSDRSMYDLHVAPWPTPWPDGTWTDEEYAAKLKHYVEDILAAGGWGVEMWHNLTGDPSWVSTGPMVNESVWRAHFAQLTGEYAESVWTAPQGTVVRYYLEREGTTVESYILTSKVMLVDLLFAGDREVFDEPLTIMTRRLDDWQDGEFTLMQAGQQLDHTLAMASVDPMAKIVITGQVGPDVTGTYVKMADLYNGEPAYKHQSKESYIWSTGKQHIFENYFLSPCLGCYTEDCWYSGGRASPIGTYYVHQPSAEGRPRAQAVAGDEEPCLLYDAVPGGGGITIWFESTR